MQGLLCVLGTSSGCSCCTWNPLWSRSRRASKFRKSCPGATPLHSEPGSKNEILFGPVPKPHNLNYIMQRDASGKCLVSVTPEPDKMEQRNHHSEGDFRFTSDLCCFFSPVTICNSSNRPFSPGLHIKPDFSLLPLLRLAYWQKSHQTNVDLTRRC